MWKTRKKKQKKAPTREDDIPDDLKSDNNIVSIISYCVTLGTLSQTLHSLNQKRVLVERKGGKMRMIQKMKSPIR